MPATVSAEVHILGKRHQKNLREVGEERGIHRGRLEVPDDSEVRKTAATRTCTCNEINVSFFVWIS